MYTLTCISYWLLGSITPNSRVNLLFDCCWSGFRNSRRPGDNLSLKEKGIIVTSPSGTLALLGSEISKPPEPKVVEIRNKYFVNVLLSVIVKGATSTLNLNFQDYIFWLCEKRAVTYPSFVPSINSMHILQQPIKLARADSQWVLESAADLLFLWCPHKSDDNLKLSSGVPNRSLVGIAKFHWCCGDRQTFFPQVTWYGSPFIKFVLILHGRTLSSDRKSKKNSQ